MIKKSIIYISWIKIGSLFLGFILLFLGWFISNENKETSQEKVIFMLDISNSMNIKDVFYNGNQISRLDIAKIYIKEYINNGNNNIGLIIFAGKANLFIPPTKDKASIITYLDTINSNSIIGGGSNIYEAIEKFITKSDEKTIGIILSDFGDNIDYNQQLNLIENIDIKGKKIVPIGVGTTKGGLVIDSNDDLITEDGTTITDKLNLTYLEKISSLVSQPYQIFDEVKEFKIGNNSKQMNFLGEWDKSSQWILLAGGFFIIIGL